MNYLLEMEYSFELAFKELEPPAASGRAAQNRIRPHHKRHSITQNCVSLLLPNCQKVIYLPDAWQKTTSFKGMG